MCEGVFAGKCTYDNYIIIIHVQNCQSHKNENHKTSSISTVFKNLELNSRRHRHRTLKKLIAKKPIMENGSKTRYFSFRYMFSSI